MPGNAAAIAAAVALLASSALAVAAAGAAASGSHVKSGCKSDSDCSLNGLCQHGKCACDPAWTGDHCQTLNIIAGNVTAGYRQINVGSPPQNSSSWGGATLYDEASGKWYMWATELTHNCGMHTWTTNSHTIRASSRDPLGQYEREEEQFPVWSHEVDVVRGPSGEYVAFMSYDSPCSRPQCTTCTDGSTDPACKKKKPRGEEEGVLIEDTDPTYMAWSKCPTCPWSDPVLVLMAHPMMDTNMAPVIKSDGTLVGMWRDHLPGGKHSTPHIVTASNWTDPSTYKWNEEPLFSSKDVPGAIEDMFLWVDARGNYHAIFHQMYDCDNCGAHAFSADGLHWSYSGTCYTAHTSWTDGSSYEFPYCERPHLVFDASGTKPVALTNGVKTGWPGLQNDDQSFTLLRPLRQ